MSSLIRPSISLIAIAIVVSLLLPFLPLSAQVDPIEPSGYSGGPGIGPIGPPQPTLTSSSGAVSSGLRSMSAATGSSADPFFLIKKTIVMSHETETFPMPDYELVDVEGSFKNAPNSVACGGTVSEGAAEDADDCQLLYQLQFENGYLKTNGTITTPNATKYNGQTGMLVVGHVGDVVQLTVQNEQPAAVNEEAIDTGFYAPGNNKQLVHWHGMELDNESDGTPVAEFGMDPEEQRLYQYRLYRPGIYWFHPHILPLLTESRGMIGRLVIRSYEEDFLSLFGVLPLTQYVFQLDDSTIANDFNKDAYRNGTVFPDFFSPFEVANNLMPDVRPDLNGDGVCDRGPGDCIEKEGEYVLVNGVVPTSDANIPTIYVPEGRGARVGFINSSVERFYRFRLLLEGEEPPGASGTPVSAERVNRSGTGQCYAPGSNVKFSGSDPLSCEQGLIMYRVGGENGLLDYVRVEGQPEIPPADPFVPRDYDQVIRTGEDFIGVSERTEFVIVTKDREGNYLEPGDSMYIWDIDYPHGIFTPKFDNTIGDGDANNRDVAPRKLVRIKIVPNLLGLPPYDIHEGDALMAHSWVHRPAEDIRTVAIDPLSSVPSLPDPQLGGAMLGLEHPGIMLGNRVADGSRFPSINAVKGLYGGFPLNGTNIRTQGATRYAKLGNVVEFIYANNTGNAHHPFHMHGFSFQPIAVYNFDAIDTDNDGIDDAPMLVGDPVYTYDYNEFLDVEVMQPGKALLYRMKMNDRFKIPDETEYSWIQLLTNFPYDYQGTFGGAGDIDNPNAEMGGGVGRWLMHCHILHHARLGMITDLCISPANATDTSECKIDIDTNIYQPIP